MVREAFPDVELVAKYDQSRLRRGGESGDRTLCGAECRVAQRRHDAPPRRHLRPRGRTRPPPACGDRRATPPERRRDGPGVVLPVSRPLQMALRMTFSAPWSIGFHPCTGATGTRGRPKARSGALGPRRRSWRSAVMHSLLSGASTRPSLCTPRRLISHTGSQWRDGIRASRRLPRSYTSVARARGSTRSRSMRRSAGTRLFYRKHYSPAAMRVLSVLVRYRMVHNLARDTVRLRLTRETVLRSRLAERMAVWRRILRGWREDGP